MDKLKPPNRLNPRKGRLLISDPFLEDPFFKRSVILLTESTKEAGAMGFMLNRPLDVKLDEILEEFPETNCGINLGGPVEKDNLFFLHTIEGMSEEDIQITDEIFWGTDFKSLKLKIADGLVDLNQIRFYLGYSGWQSEQLEKEMEDNSWFVTNAKKEHILNTNYKEMWKSTVKEMGKEFEHMANFPEDPSLN